MSLDKKAISLEALERNPELVRYYTGLPSFLTLKTLYEYLLPHLPKERALDEFKQLFVVFSRLRLVLPVKHLAILSDVHESTVIRTFHDTIGVMYLHLTPFVVWPDRQEIITDMPHKFVESIGRTMAVVVDFF